MAFRVVHKPSNSHVRCPYRIVEQAAGREIDWINKYLDYETLRRLADATLRTYAHELLHFLRWWESVHHTDVVTKDDLTESTLLDYVRFQSSQERELTAPLSTNVLPSSIAPCASPFLAPLVRSLRRFSRHTGSERPWASASRDPP
jgi:hypothetical protein